MVSMHNMRKKIPKVTVLMPVYNGEHYLREAIHSILNQTFQDFEFIIINDGSTDSSKQILESFQDARIRIFHNKTNLKSSSSLNKGLKHAKGEYIARMDADDICSPTRLEEQVKFLDDHPEIGIVGTDIEFINDSGECICDYRAPILPTSPALIRWTLFFRCCINHPSVMVRKPVYASLGGYITSFNYAEDYDLWLRASKKTQIANLRRKSLKLRKHSDNATVKYREKHIREAVLVAHKAISDLLETEVPLNTVQKLRDRNLISSETDLASVINLLYRLYQLYSKTTELSFSERFYLKTNAFSMIGKMCLTYGKKQTKNIPIVIKTILSIHPMLIYQVPFCMFFNYLQNLILKTLRVVL